MEQYRKWTDEDIASLRLAYTTAKNAEELNLAGLSLRLRRSEDAIVCKAGRLSLTDPSRPVVSQRKDRRKYATPEELKAAQSRNAKERIAKNGHPRHMLGKRHTPEVRRLIAQKGVERWAAMSKQMRFDFTTKAVRAAIEKNGRVGALASREGATWKAGWREVGGHRIYFRSRWEANYARYLQWLKDRGEIIDWEYEPMTFWFEKIRRGVRSYKPDFRVHEKNGATPLHEVKGWMDNRSKTTLKRMAKYYPQETIIVIREKQYRAIANSVSMMIGGWE